MTRTRTANLPIGVLARAPQFRTANLPIGVFAIALAFLLTTPAHPCAMFTLADADHVYFANNEDCTNAGEIWFVPAKDNRLGRVNLGWNNFTQGSMNERGLCFDCAALPEVPYTPDPNKKNTKNLLEVIMDTCATVDDALHLFDTYNCTHLASGQFMFADATGACAVVTWDPRGHISIVRRNANHLLITNDRLEWSGLRDPRYALADRLLSAASAPSLSVCTDTLDAIHQEGKDAFTSYSNIFEPKTRTLHLYNLANFSEAVTLDLNAELAKGPHKLPLTKLFKHSPNLDDYRARPIRTIPSEITLPNETLARYTGSYESKDPEVHIEIALADNKLTFRANDQHAIEIFPESQTDFRFRDTFGTLTFDVAEDHTVKGLTLHRPGDHYSGKVR